ncbi:hypothetical protein SAMN05216184_103259 [Georgenia satyanarayanai]|uniref:Lasso RiPP family leader peptide-containing protein n=1 Tax=Georgenia satyanarayanai TaxID=860221 RepID=A0A2Y9A733_9MICO|nr:lasso RiPP family leader peptide-containing protein [Georgenia satyanarayanai]PYG00686.1 hypothetical protein A8987_103259 [Georgenia satyanarayanai]SSA40075.1 hypothetical protein SAMN05216184_103259 [Georgenia satyanarayanai]
MAYEAPRVTEVGSVHGLTLGSQFLAAYTDNTVYWGEWKPNQPGPAPGSR